MSILTLSLGYATAGAVESSNYGRSDGCLPGREETVGTRSDGSPTSPADPLSKFTSYRSHDSVSDDDLRDPVDTTFVYETRDTLYVTYSPIVIAGATADRVNFEQSDATRENDSHRDNVDGMSRDKSSLPENAGGQVSEADEINMSALAVKRAQSLQTNEEKLKAFNQSFSKLMELKKQREWREEHQKLIRQREEALRGGILSGGMILDETQTRMGRNFYTIFYDNWRPPSGALNFMITISERMMPSRGTSVSIEIDDVLVFQARLQPRYSFIEEVAEQAVAVCQQKLYQMQLQSNQLQTF